MQALTPSQEATLSASGPSPDERAARQDAETWIPRLMSSLSSRQQEAVRLKFQQNLSYREIAEILEITESNVGFILHTALTSLRQEMNTLQGVNS